jgi:hypothetical protein
MPALALGRGSVQAEEVSLQADFHAILAEYVREHRLYAFHPDFEVRFAPEEKFLKAAEDRLREAAQGGRENVGKNGGRGESGKERHEELATARKWEVEADSWMVRRRLAKCLGGKPALRIHVLTSHYLNLLCIYFPVSAPATPPGGLGLSEYGALSVIASGIDTRRSERNGRRGARERGLGREEHA